MTEPKTPELVQVSAQDLKTTLELMHEGIQIVDRQWRYVYLNEAALRHGRSTSDQLIGRTMSECYPGIEQTLMFQTLTKVMNDGKARRLENFFQYPDGIQTWFEIFAEPHHLGILIRSFDITQRKELEAQLLHVQKIEAVGRLAGGLAHDLNNKLGVMMIYTQLLAEDPDHPLRVNYLTQLRLAVDNAADLTKRIIAFGRKQVLAPQVLNLSDLILESTDAVRKIMGNRIGLNFRLENPRLLGNVWVDPTQLDQIILNLALNARDAMPGEGTLTLETRNIDLDEAYSSLHPDVEPGSYVMLTISDDGLGMTEEVKRRIFDPFFTTKQKGHGTGLGLSSVHGIVMQLNGHIEVASEPGVGTTFKIYFPRVNEPVEPRAPVASELLDVRGKETLLVIEEDSALRTALETALNGAGYKVVACNDVLTASGQFKTHQGKIDLLIGDASLATDRGRKLMSEWRNLTPRLKVVYLSSESSEHTGRSRRLDEKAVLIQKPVTTRTLLETIRRVLDGIIDQGVF